MQIMNPNTSENWAGKFDFHTPNPYWTMVPGIMSTFKEFPRHSYHN